ncbi:MAG TPA: phosphoglucosamine mutase [Thermoplasmatales archaeon]|nr:phosphoglucosamine mutase [Thermoplasmatales archaeon]
MKRLFGTNGVRGITNESMNAELALKLGKAIGTYFQGNIIVATDTRTSNEMLKNAVIAGLVATGCNVFDAKIAPSPTLQYYVKHSDADAGVIITASHNPPEFNGIKVVDADGIELSRNREKEIEKIYFNERFKLAAWNELGKVYDIDILDFYIEGVLDKVDVERIKSNDFKVVVDCGNGAACYTMPYLVGQMANVISLNAQPDGNFPGREPEPTEENIKDLMRTVKAVNADLGVAYDGDADRAVFVDEKGNFIHGDKSLAIMAGYMVEKQRGKIVTPVSTSSCVEEYVKARGGEVVYTKVGAPIVARKMVEVDAVFGGEENGGLMFPSHQYCRDGGMATAAMLELLAKKGRSLSELIAEVPSYHLIKTKVRCENNREVMEKLKDAIKGKVDYTDGIKVYTERGWVLIRPSGTEPIIRIYAEAKKREDAEKLADKYKKLVESHL